MVLRNWNLFLFFALFIGLGCAPSGNPKRTGSRDRARPTDGGGIYRPVKDDVKPPKPPPEHELKKMTPEERQLALLKVRIESALEHVKRRTLLTTNSSWTVFHGILGLGLDAELVDPETQQRYKAIDYICEGGPIRGLAFIPTGAGLDVQMGPQFIGQGHQDQYVAEIAQLGMPLHRKMIVLGKEYTFEDLVNESKARARVSEPQELSWTLVALSQYYGTDFVWTNRLGEKLHFEDIVKAEVEASVERAACGGTHRLFGLTWAYYLHRKNGGKRNELWEKVAKRIRDYKAAARKFQDRRSGQFSTQYLEKAGGNRVPAVRKINTTGHVLEWLALAMTDEELKQDWVQHAARALSLLIEESRGDPLEGGSLYHATHGLQIYYDRLFKAEKKSVLPPPPKEEW